MATLPAPDGTMLVYDGFEPDAPRAQVLLLHGWSDHAGRYRWLAERLAAAGFAAYALDWRGHGRSGGRRAHLSRFSQLLGDLHTFRRHLQPRADAPQVLFGHSFGALVALRYLETQPTAAPAAAVLSAPFLGVARTTPFWRQLATRMLSDVWPTLPLPAIRDVDHLSRDPAVNAAYASDPAVSGRMTLWAWREIQWAQRAIVADGGRIEAPLLFLLGGEDRVADMQLARAFADGLKSPAEVRWYGEMYHEVFSDPQREQVLGDLLAFITRVVGG